MYMYKYIKYKQESVMKKREREGNNLYTSSLNKGASGTIKMIGR